MKSQIIILLTAALFTASCSKRLPDYVSSIPDDAVAVMTLHPAKIHSKGQIQTMTSLKEQMKDEVWGAILEDPLSSGLKLDEYVCVFMRMEEEAPVIGVVAGMKDQAKFEEILEKLDSEITQEESDAGDYTYIRPDEEGILAWNTDQMILMASPDYEEFETSYWTGALDWMFRPVKEESIASMVDFRDFYGEMKDMNLWVSSNDMRKIIERFGGDQIGDLPMNFYNNYTHLYCDFANGAMYVTGEVRWSEEVQKNIDQVLVLNPTLNRDILKMAPGGNLLMALSVSADLDNARELLKSLPLDELNEAGKQIEEATGVPAETMLDALTGDFTLAVNGLEGDVMVPVEIFIGLGVKSDEIQKQLMDQVGEMVTVEEEGDFFVINISGNEIYSGILHDTWVLTNVKGYKDAVSGGKLESSLLDSRFDEFAGGSMGLYMNLNLENYPDMVRELLNQRPEQKEWIDEVTGPFEYLGISAGNSKSLMTVKTTKPSENSLHTFMQLVEKSQ